jgi:hypothetical protein
MTTEYYFISALVIMIVMMAIYIWKVNNINDELRAEVAKSFYDEMVKRHCRVKKTVTFVNTENAGDNETLDRKVKQLQADGWMYNPSASQCPTILCFEKTEPIKEDEL